MHFSEKLRTARAARQMSQTELARAAGITARTIQNYETGAKLPRNREVYGKLAQALGVEESLLLDDNMDFVLRASEQYGERGARQAWDMVADIRAMFAGGEMEEEDMDEIMHALQDAYWEAKRTNRKYVNRRYHSETGENKE